jgi:hypothetical protein
MPAQRARPRASVPEAGGAAAPPVPDQQAQSGQTADAQVEQEISQAIQQLEAGQMPATPAGPPGQSPLVPAAQPVPRGVLIRAARMADRVLCPLTVAITLMDLPFRRLPGALRQILGYVAVGTALMTAALWYYIFMLQHR